MFVKKKFYSRVVTVTFAFIATVAPTFAFAESSDAILIAPAAKTPAEVREEKITELNKPQISSVEIAPGLQEKTYKVLKKDGLITAYFLEADKNYYNLLPALDKDLVPGRDVVTKIAAEHNAVAAINASYFAINGEILGVTKINGKTAGTTYFNRTALGIRQDGSAHIGKISYDGYVTLGDVTMPISGVDAECGENGVIVYNSFYGNSTKNNEYVTTYVIEDGKIAAIGKGDTIIPKDGAVIGVHGTSTEAFKGAQIGDSAIIFENLGKEWMDDLHIIGIGPCLVKDGKIYNTAVEEEFPRDIRVGRNPRAGFGITREGNYIFAVVDGRQPKHSIGASLNEFAQMLVDMGAMDAMNFDGGSSAELVVEGKIINSPSAGKERNIGNALLLMNK